MSVLLLCVKLGKPIESIPAMAVLILDNYDSFTYNLYQMVQAQTDEPVVVHRNNALDWAGLLQLHPSRIILSPGPGHPARPSDFGLCQTVIERHNELRCPVLGVCLGHQGLIHLSGGSVVPAPDIVHGKTSPVRILKPHPLLEGLPNPFTVMRYHSWTVERNTLPAGFELLAETIETDPAREPLIMAVAHKERPLYGVQFHPESVGTPEGARLLRNFVEISIPVAP